VSISPIWRRRIALFVVIVTFIAWPVTMFTVASSEPRWTLSLSWLALTLTALDWLSTADVRVKEEENAPGRDAG
jgi:hypothetical protein